MNFRDARQLMIGEKERQLIVDLSKSIQDQFDRIPKSFFQVNSMLDSVVPQLAIMSQTINSDFVKQAVEISKKQMEAFEVINKSLFIKPLEYRIGNNITPITTSHSDFEIAELKKQIQERDKQINLMKSKIEKDETFGLEILKNGILKYKGNPLRITTDSNAGKFLKYVIENKDHFISDEYCKSEFNCSTSKEITYIIRDLNKTYLSKNSIKAKMRRCRDAKGYVLEDIVETKS